MSEQSSHIQSTDSSGVGSMSKHSNGNIEMSDSDHTAMYGSMPDVSSDGLHRQSDTSDETSHTFPEQHGNREEESYESLPQFNPTMTSTPVKVRDPPSMSTSGRDDSSDNLQENKSVETSNVINSLFTENMKDMKEDKAEESDYMADKSEQSESTQETLKLTVLNQEGSDDVMTFKEGVEAHSASGHSSIDKSVEDAHKLMTDTESSGSALNTNILSRECFRQYSETSSSSEDDEFAYLRHPEQEKTNDQTVERNNENVEGSRGEEVRIDDVSVPTTGSGSERGGGLEEQRTSGKIGEGQDEKLSGMEDKSQESIEEVMRNEDLSIQDINTGGSVATSEDSEDILPGKEGILAHAASGHSSIDKSHEDLHQLMTDSESSGSVNAKVLSCECFRPYSPTSSSCSSLDEELQHQIEEEEKGGGDLMAQQESMNEMKLGNLFSVSDMVVKPISPVTSETERRPSEDTHEKFTTAADMESRDIEAEMSESQRSEETPDISRSENADERSISLQSVEESGQQQGFSDQSYTSTEDHLSSGTSHEDNRSNMEDLGPYGVIDHSSRTPVSFRDSIQDVVPSSYLKQKLKKRASIEMRKIQAEDVKLSDIYRPPKVESGYFRRRSLPLPEHRSYEMSDVHNEKPTYSSLPDVKVRQKTQEEQKENRSEDEAIADNSQKKTPNIPEREDSVHQESMTAFNTEVSRPVRILSREGYGEADFTSAIDLLEHLRVLSDTECDLDHSQAKAKGQHVDAAFLQKRKIEEDRHSSEMPPSKQLKSNKDTQPSNKDHSIIETDSEKPSSNNLSGITPSELLQKRDDRERTEEAGKSPGYGEFAYTTPSALMMRKESSKRVDLEGATPSRLLQRRVDRERTVEAGQSPGYGEFAYTTPSALMMRKESSKRVDLEGNTPSRLLQRRVERERTVEVGKSPGYGVLSYTSPSQLLKKQLQNKQHDAGTKYASREAVSLEGRTPSALLQRRDDRLRGEESAASPGYGAFSYTSPSQMMAKHPQEENRDTRHASSSHMVPNTKLDDESHDLGYSSFDTEQDSKHQTSESSGGMRTQSNIGDYFNQLSQILHSMSLQMPSSFSDPELRRQMESIQQGISHYSNLSGQQRGENSTNRHIGNDYSQGTNGIGAKSSGSLPGTWFFAQPTSLIRAVCEKAENKVRGNKTVGRKEIVDEPVQDQESSWSMMQNQSFLCLSDDENEEEVTSNGVGGWRYDTSTANGRGRDHTVIRQERLSDSPYPTDARQMSFNEMIWDMYCHNPEIAKEMTSSLEVNMSDGTDQGDEPLQTAREGQINAKKRQLPNAGTRSVTPDSRSWIMAKEVMESQNRKLQIENSKLELENKLLKEKYNKATAKISSLEEQLCQVQEELEAVNNNMAKELSEAQRRHQAEFTSDLEQFQNKILSLSHQNETLKAEVLSLEKQLDSAEKMSDFAKHATEKSKTVEAFKMEATSLKDEVSRVKSLLQQSERHLQDEENRNRELGQQVLKLTEMKNMLQQQLDIGSGGGVSDKQSLRDIKSQYETKLHQAEEKMQDAKSEKTTAEATYKEQLGELVKERHEAFARLKTAEDLLEAVRGENEILKKNMSGIPQQSHGQPTKQSQLETLSIELRNLENQMQQLQRSNQLLESEVTTMKVQLAAKDKALEEAASQLDIANSRLDNSEALDRKQNKIDKLTTELSSLQSDIQYATDKANKLSEEKKTLEAELERSKLELTTAKAREKESKAGGQADNKLLQSLKEEVEDSDRRSGHLSKELTSMETQIQQYKHELYTTQSHCEHLQVQVESLQRQLDQRGHILDTVSAAEREHVAQFKILKDTLDSVSLELKNKQSQNKTVTMELRREKDKVNKLLKDKGEWRENKIGPFSSGIGETQNEIKIRELTEEKEKLMEQLCEANQEMEQHVRDCTSMEKDLKQLHQELAAEKSRVLTVSTEKGELEQHLEEIAEEHDAVIQEKNQVEDDLVRLESKLQEILQTLEIESQPLLHGASDPTQIASELESLKLINEARCKEMETLKDKISRQSMEMNFLQRRVELLHSENQSNREDISRLTGELANKIKESVSIRDINQFLVGEKSRLESDIGSLQQEMVWEREHVQKESAQLTQTIQKSELHDQQSECDRLRQQTNTLTMDLESCRVQLTAAKESVDNLKQDKGAIYQEYDSMCRRLSEKDQKIQELQEKNEVMVREMKQEFSQQQSTLEKEKTSTERQLDKAKEQITVLNEEIKQKDLQLSTFGKTLAELDDVTKQKNELALHVSRAEKTSGDSKIVVDGQRDEIISLQETISRMQEIQSKIQVEKSKLEEEFRESESAHASQVQELNQTISTLRSHSEGEKIYLKDNLSQSQNRLQSIESSLASAIESRDKLQVSNRTLERSLEDTKGELQDKITLLKVAEQRAETLQTQLNESRKDRFLTEEKLNTIQYEHSKAEKELRTEKEKSKQYQEKVQEQEAVSYSNEMTAKSKQEQVDILQGEITKLKQIIDNQKQQLGGRLKKSTVEFKQQIELIETERSQIVQQNQQLQLDLERARDQIQLKNKENLKLQEEMLVFEEQIREKTQKLKHAEDTLKAEEDLQSRLSSKYQAQEDELKQLRTFLTKKAEESGDAEKVMWQEMNKVIQEMSRQMASHFDTQKSPEKIVDKEQVSKVVKKYKRQISDLETDLNTERALHQITRTSLQALEEDCQRLRKQFHAMKRRDHATDKKYKNRMEAINEIIARSQTQAQAMLAAGGQFEETLRSLTTPINTPRGIDYGGRVSPDSSVASDFSFNSIGPSVIPPYNPSSPRKQ